MSSYVPTIQKMCQTLVLSQVLSKFFMSHNWKVYQLKDLLEARDGDFVATYNTLINISHCDYLGLFSTFSF